MTNQKCKTSEVEDIVKPISNGAHIYLSKDWIANKVKTILLSSVIVIALVVIAQQQQVKAGCNNHCQYAIKQSKEIGTTKDDNDVTGFAEIDASPAWTSWNGVVLDTATTSTTLDGVGSSTISFPCSNGGIYSLVFQKQIEDGSLHVKIVKQGTILKETGTSAAYGVISLAGRC